MIMLDFQFDDNVSAFATITPANSSTVVQMSGQVSFTGCTFPLEN